MNDVTMNVGPVTFEANVINNEVTVSAPTDVVDFCAAIWESFLKEMDGEDLKTAAGQKRRDQLINRICLMVAMIGDKPN